MNDYVSHSYQNEIISVEFLGLPASGKSTYSDALTKSFQCRGIPIYSFRGLYQDLSAERHTASGFSMAKFLTWYYFFCFFIRNLSYSLDVCYKVIQMTSVQSVTRIKLLRFFLREGAAYYFYRKRPSNGLIISDEGFLHRLIAYGFSQELSNSVVTSYIKKCPLSDIVVIFKQDHNDVKSRRSVTSDPFCQIFNITNEAARVQELKLMEANLNLIEASLKKTNANLIVLDKDTSVEKFLKIFDKNLSGDKKNNQVSTV